MKVLIRKGKKYYWNQGDLHTSEGVIKEEDIINAKGNVTNHLGKEFTIFDASFVDELQKIKRGPAIMLPKDIGAIIANTGIDKDSIVIDSGTGCGVTSAMIARLVRKVITYEKKEEFYKIAKKNFKKLGITNIELKNKDISEGIDEEEADLITLDLPEPWNVLKHALNVLKSGSFVVSYLPTIIQVKELVERSRNFYHEKTIEILEREWFIEGKKVRPKNQMLGHTGFLVFLRKI